ncbi:serine dehydratase subunit alpha family protein [Haloimpatiens lingqiaonensis]|uniref:L-cysteine desulfidase family protein n=1 Tax=Haloimpatiens lingqiaonensis TaxID=1380675 RepID=UPI0010FD4DA5|nr:L-serine ammonia-lyase, iron-sulfur-dependent, subunit alpha [Haloimpatiens lingqiaonensis]
MKINDKEYFIGLLKNEVVPALGCTEPIAVALASSKACKELNLFPEKIQVFVSPNILKNGMGVGIPGTGMVGLDIAAALGAIGGNADAQLEVLKDITKEDINKSKEFLNENRVHVTAKDVPDKLYVEVKVFNGEHSATVIIKEKHSNIVSIEVDGKYIFKKENNESNTTNENKNSYEHTTVEEIYNFAINADFKDIEFILEGAKMNKAISEDGLKNDYGLKVGKTLFKKINDGILSNDLQNYAMAVTSAASDARMAGCMLPVMSNSGSGNQGITVMMPVVAAAEKLNVSDEKLARALVLANLVAIHIKSYLGRLSALCGCVVASSGASCGITYLMGGNLENIIYSIKNMAGNIAGMICDGAKTGCALKVSTGVSAAIQSSLLAMEGIEISEKDGIIDKDIEKTIKNIAEIGAKGMSETDKLILDIMICK